eukprot:Gb_01844 [translate_table: standard]
MLYYSEHQVRDNFCSCRKVSEDTPGSKNSIEILQTEEVAIIACHIPEGSNFEYGINIEFVVKRAGGLGHGSETPATLKQRKLPPVEVEDDMLPLGPDLWKIINGTELRPINGETATKWEQREDKALATILFNLKDTELLHEEVRRKDMGVKSETPTALYVGKKSYPKKEKPATIDCQSSSKKNRFKCHYCKKAANEEAEESKLFVTMLATTVSDQNLWYIDSGASRHMLPWLTKNLLPVRKIADVRMKVEFDSSMCMLKNNDGNLVAKGVRCGSLYKLCSSVGDNEHPTVDLNSNLVQPLYQEIDQGSDKEEGIQPGEEEQRADGSCEQDIAESPLQLQS